MLILVMVVYTSIAIYEFIPLYKHKLWREFGVNIVLGLLSLVIAAMISFGMKIPSPAYPIKELITSLLGK